MHEKRPSWEFFLVRFFLYSVVIQKNNDQKKTTYLDTFHAVERKFLPNSDKKNTQNLIPIGK